MLERSKRMTRIEHREANHLEDDGGIREIIQGAEIIPISIAEQSSYGQMAPLETPQQLWARPGWSHFSRSNKTTSSDRVGTKRKFEATSLDDSKNDEVQPRKKAAFVDSRNSGPVDRHSFEDIPDEGTEDDDQTTPKHIPTELPATSPESPVHSSLLIKSDDPYMPSMGHPLAPDDQGDGPATYVAAVSSPTIHEEDDSMQEYRRVAISQLLSHESTSREARESEQKGLLEEILRRL